MVGAITCRHFGLQDLELSMLDVGPLTTGVGDPVLGGLCLCLVSVFTGHSGLLSYVHQSWITLISDHNEILSVGGMCLSFMSL